MTSVDAPQSLLSSCGISSFIGGGSKCCDRLPPECNDDQMPTGKRKPLLSPTDISRSFDGESGQQFGPILTTEDVARLLQIPVKTLYFWIADGRLDGTFRKRGKRHLFWRDKVIDKVFNGKEKW